MFGDSQTFIEPSNYFSPIFYFVSFCMCFVCISHHVFICLCFHLGLWPSGFWIK